VALRLALVAVLVLGITASAGADQQERQAASAKPFVVKVHADWCGTCTMLEPTWIRIENELGGKARVVVFDVTDKQSLEKARAAAEVLGLVEFFDRYKSKTGTIGVLAADGTPVVVLKGERDFGAYDAAVEKASAS
jgi:thiol-disulfide isomerase/thioredoxin